MKLNLPNTLDQSEALTLLERLQLHAAYLRGLCHASDGKTIAPPALSQDVLESIDILQAHCTALEGQLGDTAPAFNFNPGAAAAARAVSNKAPNIVTKTLTLTQRVLAAQGVKTLAELPMHRDLLD